MPLHPVQLIRSASDIGSAVAHRLKQAGYRPVLLEGSTPTAIRRLMCFAGAVYEGEAELEGLRGRLCASAEEALACSTLPGVIPLLVQPDDGEEALPLSPEVLVDARMRKKREPAKQIGLAPLVIGIGPGFVAGQHAHVVIESNWGQTLGRVIREGGSEAYTGMHRVVAGVGAGRYVYAPHDGVLRTELTVLSPVAAGQVVATLDDTPLVVESGGLLRGLAYSGGQITRGTKLIEVDPTGQPENCRGIGERPASIAAGVLEAIRSRGYLPPQ